MVVFWIAQLCFLGLAFGGKSENNVPPTWSQTYAVKGLLTIPYAELQEPFDCWYDGSGGQSRIDYYGGMVKTYQLSKSVVGHSGTSLKITPVTTEKVLNQLTCLQVNGSDDAPISTQSVLPNLDGFNYIGDETIGDSETQKWRLVNTVGDKENKYTMWIKFKKSGDHKQDASIAIPVRYEMRGFNSLLGSHYDHYYLEYEEYNVDAISPDVFKLETDMKCTGFPGPGSKHYYTFNPMMEFIHPVADQHFHMEFYRFAKKHRKSYSNDVELNKRKDIFRQNLRFIHSKNRARVGYSLSVNHLADRTETELKALRGRVYSVDDNGASAFPYTREDVKFQAPALPVEYDWRLFGAVTPVKDQSVCGSCWSFGTIGAVEGAYFLHNGGHLVRLSQQALIDCSWGYGNNGCDGGEDFRSYQWIMKHGGVPTENQYGNYLGQDGYCHIENVTMVAPITGYVNVTAEDPNALKLAIFKHGPISVAIDASHKSFSFYSNGVYFEPKCGNKIDELDHAVLAVGYGILNGHPYWLIKNSWSNYWGNDGYVLMSARQNNCGVMTTPTYVTM